jgi:tRNA(Arg) A34 adenosine deaminase TadA
MDLPDISIRHPRWMHELAGLDRSYPDDEARMHLAIMLARENVLQRTGGPFGAAVFEAESGRLVGAGTNGVIPLNNSCAHAEVVAIMTAQARLGRYSLRGDGLPAHELFTSCEPCAMCLGAAHWSGVTRLVFAATRDDAARLDFDEGPVFPQSYRYLEERGVTIEGALAREEANAVFDLYTERGGAIYNG